MNEGAFYYIQKPFANDELLAILRRAAEHPPAAGREQAAQAGDPRGGTGAASRRPIGKSRRFLDVLRLAETVAPTDSTVLIQGESGTGKEVIARYIHDLSTRRRRAVPVDQLRRAAGEPARERAVRAREGLVHRRGARQAGALRGRAGRDVLPRRDRRDAAVRSRSSCCACCRSAK